MNNLNTRIILINQYFRLFFKFYTPPISNLYIHQFSRQLCSLCHSAGIRITNYSVTTFLDDLCMLRFICIDCVSTDCYVLHCGNGRPIFGNLSSNNSRPYLYITSTTIFTSILSIVMVHLLNDIHQQQVLFI